jgi:hypothetical protein
VLENLDEVLPELPFINEQRHYLNILEEVGRALSKRYFQAKKNEKNGVINLKPLQDKVNELQNQNEKLVLENKTLREKLIQEGDSRAHSMFQWKRDREQLERNNQTLRITNEKLLSNLQKVNEQMKHFSEMAKQKSNNNPLAKTKFFEEESNNAILPTLCYFYENQQKVDLQEFEAVIYAIARKADIHDKSMPRESITSKNFGMELLSKINLQKDTPRTTNMENIKIHFHTEKQTKTGECAVILENVKDVKKIVIQSVEFYSEKEIKTLKKIEPIIINLLENYRKLEMTQESMILSLPKTGRLGESKALEDLVKDLNDFDSVKEESNVHFSEFNNNHQKHSKSSNLCSLEKKIQLSQKLSTDPQISKNFSFAYLPSSGGSGSNVQFFELKSKLDYKTNTITEVDEIEELFSGSEVETQKNTIERRNSTIKELEDKIENLEVRVNRVKSKSKRKLHRKTPKSSRQQKF